MASTLNPSSPVAPPRTSLPPPSERADEKNEITPPVTNHASIHIPLSVSSSSGAPLTFSDIGYKIPNNSGKVLLSGVTGQVQPGTMMAVMGPSGAGKSTFLDVMARRRLNGASGKICLGDEEIATAEEMGGVASYVEQRDDLLGVLTVRESIAYAARLRLPTEPRESIRQRVDTIITSLGLTRCANQILGNPIQKGVSGGQKRRVTIGMSLVTYPKVLFLDEPTSGLDATTSREVMGAIARIAQEQGMIVIATIHQPNFETLSLFSSILILAEGKVMYNGDLKEMDAYFEAYGTPIPRFVNPSDHAIDLINTDFDAPDKPTTHVETLSLFYRRHADAKDNYIRSCVGMAKEMDVKGDGLNGFGRFMRHTMILSERMALSYVRNLLAYGVRVGMYLGMGIMMATIWVRLGTKDSTINDRMSVHFFSVAFLSFMSVAGIPAFLEERSVFVREKHNGLYKAGPYALANSLVNIPFLFLCAFLFTAIAYWAIGLNGTASAFFRFLGFLFLAIYTAESQTVLISALIPIFIAALAIGAFMNGFWMCVQGYFIKAISLPRFWYYSFHFMDYQRYAFELLANNDLRGLNFDCAPNPALNGTCQCAYPSSLGPDACTVSGDDVLQYLDIKWISLGHWSAILIAIGVIYRILFYIVLARSK